MTDPLSMAWDNVGIGSFNIVDAHGHIGAVDNFLIPETSADDVVNTMDQLNITRCYISPLIGMYDAQLGHKHILDAVRRFSGRIAGVPIANPNYPEEIGSYLLGWCKDLDARMIKVHPNFHDYPINGPRYRPVLEFAAKHALPVLVHTWAGDPTCDPEIFMRLAAEHPETIFILGHSGATVAGNRRAVEVAKARANVYLDLACSITYDGMLEWMVQEVGASKILFGTDVVFLDPRPQFGRVLLARISVEDKQRILGANTESILRQYSWHADFNGPT